MKSKIFILFAVLFLASCMKDLEVYTITVVSSDPNMGSVSGGGTFSQGTTATLQAFPNPSYRFSRWQDGNTQNPRTLTVDDNATYTAYFDFAGNSTTRTIYDVVGTYSASVYNWDDSQWEEWSSVTINKLSGSDEVFIYGFNNRAHFHAYGDWDQANQCIRLKFGEYNTSMTFLQEGILDTLYAVFIPVYIDSSTNEGYFVYHEVLLKYNNSGQLFLTASEQPDENGRYANAFTWGIFKADDDSYISRYYIFMNLTMRKGSSKTSHNSYDCFSSQISIINPNLNLLKM